MYIHNIIVSPQLDLSMICSMTFVNHENISERLSLFKASVSKRIAQFFNFINRQNIFKVNHYKYALWWSSIHWWMREHINESIYIYIITNAIHNIHLGFICTLAYVVTINLFDITLHYQYHIQMNHIEASPFQSKYLDW